MSFFQIGESGNDGWVLIWSFGYKILVRLSVIYMLKHLSIGRFPNFCVFLTLNP